MSTCQFTDRLTAYLHGEVPAEEAAAIEAHLAECPACSESLSELKSTADALAAWTLDSDLTSRAEAIVTAALSATTAKPVSRKNGFSVAWFAASVASAVLGFLLGAWVLLASSGSQPQQGSEPLLDDFHPLPLGSRLLESLEEKEAP